MKTGIKYSKEKLPYYNVLFKQFPLALEEIIRCSKAGHEKYNKNLEDEDWQNFSRVPNAKNAYLNAAMRHLKDSENSTFNEDMGEFDPNIRHLAQFCWNGLAALELEMREIHKRYEKSEIPEDIDKVPLTKEECFPTEPVICETTKEQREKLNKLRKLSDNPTKLCEYDRNILDPFIINKHPIKSDWIAFISKLKRTQTFSRPTLSVDQLLNQEDEYPDFNDSEI